MTTLTTINMNKQVYEQPLAEIYEIEMEGTLLDGSVEAMTTVEGSWD